MGLKQISLSMPETLFKASSDYSEEFGYRSVQEFILELVRNKVVLERIERYKEIENQMKAGKNVRKFNQKEAARYVNSLKAISKKSKLNDKDALELGRKINESLHARYTPEK
jgi:metal-responsive CopG/Arc/MetJ family transcriptional regulator